jgi:L-malate glycosyltransferase
MNILFYFPLNLRSRDTESLMEAFIKQGHRVFLLCQAEEGIYQQYCRKMGVETTSHVLKKSNGLLYFLRHTLFLTRFCKKNNIDVVYAHLETAGLPAVLAQYFIRARVYACRHVIDAAYLSNSRKFVLLTRIVYRLAKHIIVVSERCKEFMIAKEGISGKKIQVIFLAYNFNLYDKPDPKQVDEIKRRFPAELLLLTAGRLVGLKRTELAINVSEQLVKKGIKARLVILGTGPDSDKLKNYIASRQLNDCVFMEGFQLNVMDYLAACDVLIHPSLSESSSVIIKEAGLSKKPVLTCAGVGDADDYLVHGKNAILVPVQDTENKMLEGILELLPQKEKRHEMGTALHDLITERFSIHSILPFYDRIHQDISAGKR